MGLLTGAEEKQHRTDEREYLKMRIKRCCRLKYSPFLSPKAKGAVEWCLARHRKHYLEIRDD